MTTMSTTLRETQEAGCSAAQAHGYLVRHFTTGEKLARTMLLRVPFADLGLDREVDVTLEELPARPGEYVMQVGWAAKGGGPYPVFIGSLACLPRDATHSDLALEGTYTIPGGVAGHVFDAAVGHRVAVAAAHSLLTDLREILQAARASDAGTLPA